MANENNEDKTKGFPMRLRPITVERFRKLRSLFEIHDDKQVTFDEALNLLLDSYLDNNPEFQQHLKSEALATSNVRG